MRRDKDYPRHSGKVTDSKRWAALRVEALRRDGFACVKCGARGRLEVDHVLGVRIRPDLAYVLANLQSLCPPCHTQKTRLECGMKPTPPKVAEWRNLLRAPMPPGSD